jgi:hypothetical protein
MKRLEKLYFLIHGFCYAGMTCDRAPSQVDDRLQRYLARERMCAERWYARLGELSAAQALVVIPWGSGSPAADDFYASARAALGDRLFMLDCPDILAPEFWSSSAGDHGRARRLLAEIGTAFDHQQLAWNKEELYTTFHSYACSWQFQAMLAQRGFSFDPASVSAEAWGASFDGCVTKYTLNLRRILGLSNVVGIDFNLTVPDAYFLLDAVLRDCLILLDNKLRLFLFECEQRFAGLYTFTEHSIADPLTNVILTVDAETIIVKSKQNIRLWPQPEEYRLRDVDPGYYEPPQTVVKRLANGLQLPVSSGVVYRLAKAPAYIFMPAEMPYAQARSILASAKLGDAA